MPLRSARSWNAKSAVPSVAPCTSGSVVASPGPLSGSLLVIDVNVTCGFGLQVSLTTTVAVTSNILWLGGNAAGGVSATLIVGSVVSTTEIIAEHMPEFNESSAPVKVMLLLPSGIRLGALLAMGRDASQASVADAPAKKAASCGSVFATPLLPVHSATTGGGHVSVGSSVSRTATCGDSAKKMLPTASMRIRAFELSTPGAVVTFCDPSFSVPAANVVGNDPPPLVESRMLTVGATLPPPTSQVTGLGTAHSSAPPVLGLVIAKGAPATVTIISSSSAAPPPTRLSRAVERNVIVRSVLGSCSPSVAG